MVNGATGILVLFFIYGFIATAMSIVCEKYFGGYTLGTVIVYNSCFSVFWVGGCTENMVVAIFYGFIAVLIFYLLATYFKLIEPSK